MLGTRSRGANTGDENKTLEAGSLFENDMDKLPGAMNVDSLIFLPVQGGDDACQMEDIVHTPDSGAERGGVPHISDDEPRRQASQMRNEAGFSDEAENLIAPAAQFLGQVAADKPAGASDECSHELKRMVETSFETVNSVVYQNCR